MIKIITFFTILIIATSSNFINSNIKKLEWEFSGSNRELLILVLEHKSFNLERASAIKDLGSCYKPNTPLSYNELKQRSDGFLLSTQYGLGIRTTNTQFGIEVELPTDTLICGEFIIFEQSPTDFGSVTIFDKCRGRLLFAGQLRWLGRGKQIYPMDELSINNIKKLHMQCDYPIKQIIVESLREKPTFSFPDIDKLLSLNIVHEFSKNPYYLFAYLYRPTHGLLDSDIGEWIIILYREFPIYNK